MVEMRGIKAFAAFLAAAAAAAAGCSSGSNQKFGAPLVGTVRNSYYVYYLQFDGAAAPETVSNAVEQVKAFQSGSHEGNARARITVGRGSSLVAIDNQFLVGRDIGNVSSNDVSGSLDMRVDKK